jgi:hypothetical protein
MSTTEYWRALLSKGDGQGLVSYPVAVKLNEAGLIQHLPPEPKRRRSPVVFVRLTEEARSS